MPALVPSAEPIAAAASASVVDQAAAGAYGERGPIPDKAMLSARELANHYGLPVNRVQTRLRRWRGENHRGWNETDLPGVREPKFLYEFGRVKHVLEPGPR